MNYDEFIKTKRQDIIDVGFIADNLNKNLFPFQKFVVKLALKKGRYAIFADCGLGKTIMQLEWARQILKKENKPVLILAPLAVAEQTIQEGYKFGISVRRADVEVAHPAIYITNYEQLDNINIDNLCGVVLDESSILKNFEGKFRNRIIKGFKNTPYKLACTATPSPNDPMELGNHAEFLGVMSRLEMLSMYFVHDGGRTSKWRLKGHAINDFWQFVSRWASMFSKPSDIGFVNDGFILPELNIIEKEIKTHQKSNGLLFNDVVVNATNFNQELKETANQRIEEVLKVAQSIKGNIIIWVKHNAEGDILAQKLKGSIQVKGSDKPAFKRDKLLGFANNDFRILITKTKIAQFGLNYQNCHNQIFASFDFSFESLYQAIRRSYRFMQKKDVNIYLITTDTMGNVLKAINDKKRNFDDMNKSMAKKINIKTKVIMNGQNEIINKDNYSITKGDSVNLIKRLKTDSVHMALFSPPFAELYVYSKSSADLGNSKNYHQFFEHFNFMIPELYRVMLPGRLVVIHCMDLPIQKGKDGFIGLRDFSGMIVAKFTKQGFIYHDRITIWKNPVTEMQRTKALGLLHKQTKKDSTMSRTGIPDYLLVFRKEGQNNSAVNLDITVDTWQKWASPIWMDINYSNTLQKASARAERDEKHICPLQLDIIERAIRMWTNEEDMIFDPFAGIGSTGYMAIELNRKFTGFELKSSYFEQMKKNLKNITEKKMQLTI